MTTFRQRYYTPCDEVVGYTYGADTHCLRCARTAYGDSLDTDWREADAPTTDDVPVPVFAGHDWYHTVYTCGTCGERSEDYRRAENGLYAYAETAVDAAYAGLDDLLGEQVKHRIVACLAADALACDNWPEWDTSDFAEAAETGVSWHLTRHGHLVLDAIRQAERDTYVHDLLDLARRG